MGYCSDVMSSIDTKLQYCIISNRCHTLLDTMKVGFMVFFLFFGLLPIGVGTSFSKSFSIFSIVLLCSPVYSDVKANRWHAVSMTSSARIAFLYNLISLNSMRGITNFAVGGIDNRSKNKRGTLCYVLKCNNFGGHVFPSEATAKNAWIK